MVSALDFGSSVPGSSPGQGHLYCVLGHTLLSQCFSPPRSINGYRRILRETCQFFEGGGGVVNYDRLASHPGFSKDNDL